LKTLFGIVVVFRFAYWKPNPNALKQHIACIDKKCIKYPVLRYLGKTLMQLIGFKSSLHGNNSLLSAKRGKHSQNTEAYRFIKTSFVKLILSYKLRTFLQLRTNTTQIVPLRISEVHNRESSVGLTLSTSCACLTSSETMQRRRRIE